MLLCPKTFYQLHRSLSPLKSLPFLCPPLLAVASPAFKSSAAAAKVLRCTPTPAIRSFSSSAGEMTAVTAVDHIVLFKVRSSTETPKITAMISNLRSLISLPGVLHLHCGPILRNRSLTASTFGFTHLLHSRYLTKEDLASYSSDPAHVSVVREFVLPICDEILAVDWIGEFDSDLTVPPGSAARLTLMKLIENAGAGEKNLVLEALGSVEGLEKISFGENFSPARSKGFSLGALAIFNGIEELDELDGKKLEVIEKEKEKVRPLLESLIVLDFIVAPQTAGNSGL